MARILSALPLTLVLAALSAPTFAGPPITTQGPGDGGAPAAGQGVTFIRDCQINGRVEQFAIVGTTLRDRPGTVTQLDTDLYSIVTDQGTFLLTNDDVQITGGPDAGKWDCVVGAASTPPINVPGAAPAIDPGAMAALEQRLATARAALEASQEDLITTIIERDVAQGALAAAEADRNAAMAGLDAANAAQNEALAEIATLRAAQAQAEAEVATRDASLVAALDQIREGELARAELETALAAAAAANAALSEELAAAHAEQDMAETDMTEETSEEDAMSEDAADAAMMFDADAAMAMLEGAEISDISRAALTAAISQARDNPDMAAEVMARLQNALGQ